MNLFYLRYFVTLAHVKHYTKAAQQLCITQPSLSHAIAQMEKELGVPLFEKNGRNTLLTPFGREFLACAEHTLSTAQCPWFRTDTSGLCTPAWNPFCPAAGGRIFTGIPGK